MISKTSKVERRLTYLCQECAYETKKWQGQCINCQAWNTLVESEPLMRGYSGSKASSVMTLNTVELESSYRLTTHVNEFDRVLGGGIMDGSVILIGGDPGVGKSSLLLQVMTQISTTETVLYVTGEESLAQVALRAQRMSLPMDKMQIMVETNVDHILSAATRCKPKVMVVDSIQTMYLESIASAPGGVSQVREVASVLTQYGKKNQCAIFIIGHVTKSGEVAGPRVLEHIVDAVIYLEGKDDGRYRILRTIKNRFGAVNEIGIFAMTNLGLKAVKNPSAIFLSRVDAEVSGTTVVSLWEGSRPILVEIQALVDENHYGQPRRLALGVDPNRLSMLLAVLHRHANVSVSDRDVFTNIVGGIKTSETSLDLAVLCAIVSSLYNKVIPRGWLIFGEVGLSGEIRPVPFGQDRMLEALKHGFNHIILPKGNCMKTTKDSKISNGSNGSGLKEKKSNITILGVDCLSEAVNLIRGIV